MNDQSDAEECGAAKSFSGHENMTEEGRLQGYIYNDEWL